MDLLQPSVHHSTQALSTLESLLCLDSDEIVDRIHYSMTKCHHFDLVVLDEICIAMRYDYLSTADVIAGLEARDKRTGVILTGRDAKPENDVRSSRITVFQ